MLSVQMVNPLFLVSRQSCRGLCRGAGFRRSSRFRWREVLQSSTRLSVSRRWRPDGFLPVSAHRHAADAHGNCARSNGRGQRGPSRAATFRYRPREQRSEEPIRRTRQAATDVFIHDSRGRICSADEAIPPRIIACGEATLVQSESRSQKPDHK